MGGNLPSALEEGNQGPRKGVASKHLSILSCRDGPDALTSDAGAKQPVCI